MRTEPEQRTKPPVCAIAVQEVLLWGDDPEDQAGHWRPVWSMVYWPVRIIWEMGTKV